MAAFRINKHRNIPRNKCRIFYCHGVISDNAYGRLMAESFLAVTGQPIPIRYFIEEVLAKEWLKQYL
jgi:hypothetical protein